MFGRVGHDAEKCAGQAQGVNRLTHVLCAYVLVKPRRERETRDAQTCSQSRVGLEGRAAVERKDASRGYCGADLSRRTIQHLLGRYHGRDITVGRREYSAT